MEAEGNNPRQTDPWNDIIIIILCLLTWYFGKHLI